jgi:transcriptional regulator with XRE-family HTH domain
MLFFSYGTNDTKRENSYMMQRSLAARLRILRAERGLTQEQAAELAHVTPETLSDLERGRRRAYMPTLAKIAKGYGVPVEELLEEPVPLADPLLAGGMPHSLEELLERRGARTRHLADENLLSKLRQASPEGANKIAEEVSAELVAITPDLVRLHEARHHDPKAARLWNEVQNRRWIVRLSVNENEPEGKQTLRKFRELDLVLGAATA